MMIIHRLGSISSTNDLLREMADNGAPEWTAVMAENQTAGRGRMGRKWHSPPGNLYLSVLLRPGMESGELSRMSLLMSLAVYHAISQKGVTLRLKWPNDILWKGRKLAGILLEGKTMGAEVIHVIAGIGINLTMPREALPGDLASHATSLEEAGIVWSREELLTRLETAMRRYSPSIRGMDWERAMREWSLHADWTRDYVFMDGSRRVLGRPVELNREGHLILETDMGRIPVRSGDLVEI